MNVSRLLEFIAEIMKFEAEQNVQKKLNSLNEAVNQVAGNPGDANQQNEVATRFANLRSALDAIARKLTPAQMQFLEEINADWAFAPKMADEIAESMRENAMVPVKVRDLTTEYVNKRNKILNELRESQKNLLALGFKASALEPGESELGFLIPRDLFQNNLGGLAKQFVAIDRVVRTFAEALDEDTEVIVDEISTTDPLVFVYAGYRVVKAVGGAIEFFLDKWEQVERIRKLRAETESLSLGDDFAAKYDEVIKQTVANAVKEQVDKLVADGQIGRANELRTGLTMSMEWLMTHVEHGMRVEVRYLEPPKIEQPPSESDGELIPQEQEQQDFAELGRIQHALQYQRLGVERPLLQLSGPPPEPEATTAPAKEAKRPRRPRSSRAKKGD